MKTLKFTKCATGLCLAGFLLGYSYSAKAVVGIASYSFPNGALTPSTANANATVTSVSLGTGTSQNSGLASSGVLGLNTYPQSTTLALAIATNAYFQFTVTPHAGYLFDLTSLTFQANIGSGNGGFDLRSSLDNFTSDIAATGTAGSGGTFSSISSSLAASQYQNVAGSITFREYAWSGSGSTNDVESLSLNGSAVLAPTPEPSTLSLIGLGAAAMVLFVVRHNRAAGVKA